jgi:hypothetical protein
MGSYLDVDTSGCKFSEDSVMYFSELFGQGGQWTKVGQTSLYSSSKDRFRVYVSAVKGDSALSWQMNALQNTVQWCGVGRSTGPKQSGVCCGTGSPNDFVDTGGSSESEREEREGGGGEESDTRVDQERYSRVSPLGAYAPRGLSDFDVTLGDGILESSKSSEIPPFFLSQEGRYQDRLKRQRQREREREREREGGGGVFLLK